MREENIIVIRKCVHGGKALAVLLVLFLSGCSVSDYPDERNDPSIANREAGDFRRTLSYNGLNRSYFLHVPPESDSSIPAPLVIALHGATGNGDSLRCNPELALNKKGDNKGFIMVYPEGTGDSETRSFHWNAAHCCGSAWIDNIDDVGFIKHLIETLTVELHLDPSRIFVLGFSNGGMMAYRLAAEIPEKLAAISSLAGAIGGRFSENHEVCTIPIPSQPVPVLIVHGLQDQEVPYYGGNIVAANGRSDLPVSAAVSFWVTHNVCDPNSIIETGQYKEYTRDVYTPLIRNGKIIILYTIRDLAHDWPMQIGDSTATDIILDFFYNL
ncbi:MAG: alpha/beta fold hydrolase [Candidatus Aminicenantes bacterium]|nr:alpha/beta fold hydrolase [Candidatus Aminicenantes bacterium]